MLDLVSATALLRVLSDPTRVRLLALLRREELTVAELSSVLRLAQPRVSTHLAKLKETGLVRDRRAGVSAYYRFNESGFDGAADLLRALEDGVDDAMLDADAQRLPSVLAARARDRGWADSVAGDMERHYSPGRTWETLARTLLQLLKPATCWTSLRATACWPNYWRRMRIPSRASIPVPTWSRPRASASRRSATSRSSKATCTR